VLRFPPPNRPPARAAPGPRKASAASPGSPDRPQPGQPGIPSFDEIKGEFRSPTGNLNQGLLEPMLVRLPGDIVFDFDSAHLRPSAEPLLQQAMNLMKKFSSARIQVDGHTDTIGPDAYNQTLSENRAASVASWFRARLPEASYPSRPRAMGKRAPW